MEKLESRETKGLYASAKKGKINNVVGYDIDFPEPVFSDIIIDNETDYLNFEEVADRVLACFMLEKI